jgi:pyridoxal phosphate enzyme (YggS family)
VNDIAANLARIHETIATAARAADRSPDDIRLIAVSKGHPLPALEKAIAAGQRRFGENTMQESLQKISSLTEHPIEWHFIGHLQSNKAKLLPSNFAWLHSLDSLNLAERISRFAREKNTTVDALIEVNVTGDRQKHGIAPDRLQPLLDQLLRQNLPGVRLRGLTTIGPHPAEEREIRAAFSLLRGLRDAAAQRFGLNRFTELSMGMSGDYIEAIKEGATMIRIGTAIFGERSYAKV